MTLQTAPHSLLTHKRIPLNELLRCPLALCNPQICEGYAKHVERVLRRADMEPLIAELVASCDLMMALVSAGLALGLTGDAHISTKRKWGVVARPLPSRAPSLTTHPLRLGGEPCN